MSTPTGMMLMSDVMPYGIVVKGNRRRVVVVVVVVTRGRSSGEHTLRDAIIITCMVDILLTHLLIILWA
jgi:hypothetical protein